MKTRVRKWGNRLAVHIPKSFAAAARLAEDMPVELSLIDGQVVIRHSAYVPERGDAVWITVDLQADHE